MRKTSLIYFVLFFLLRSSFLSAQLNTSAAATVMLLKDEQEKFLPHLHKISHDPGIMNNLSGYIESETNGIRSLIMSDISLPDYEKAKAISSLVYFLKYLSKNIDQKKSRIYDIPDALRSYKSLLKALLHHGSVTDIL